MNTALDTIIDRARTNAESHPDDAVRNASQRLVARWDELCEFDRAWLRRHPEVLTGREVP